MLEVTLIEITPDAEKLIESAGRTAYQSHDNMKEGSEISFIKHLIKRGHESVLEHASATFRIEGCSRAMTHQIVRHRIASFTQQSQRYVNEANFNYVIPPSISKIKSILDGGISAIEKKYIDHMKRTKEFYIELQKYVKGEDARFVLPNATCSEIVMTANMREWRHFLTLRGNKHAQWEIREVAIWIYEELKHRVPSIVCDFKFDKATHTLIKGEVV